MKTLITILTTILIMLFIVSLVEAAPKTKKVVLVTAKGKLIQTNPGKELTGWRIQLIKPLKISFRHRLKFIEVHTVMGKTGFANYFYKYRDTVLTVKGPLKKEGNKYFIQVSEVILGD